jgi:hypothetical protein
MLVIVWCGVEEKFCGWVMFVEELLGLIVDCLVCEGNNMWLSVNVSFWYNGLCANVIFIQL